MKMKLYGSLLVVAVAVALVVYLAGCGGGGASLGGDNSDAAEIDDLAAASEAPLDGDLNGHAANEIRPAQGSPPTLTLSLNASLNQTNDAGNDVIKATGISRARMFRGNTSVQATIVGATAVFDLTGIGPGLYKITINGLTNDFIPTRIANPNVSTTQVVGTTLRNSYIGGTNDSNARFKLKSWAPGQNKHKVVRYSTGTQAFPVQYAYGIIYLQATTPRVEFRRLATHTLLVKKLQSNHNIKTFLWSNTAHGTNPTGCGNCHGDINSKATNHADITQTNGWCFTCHYGPTGANPSGHVKPNQ